MSAVDIAAMKVRHPGLLPHPAHSRLRRRDRLCFRQVARGDGGATQGRSV